MSNVLGVTLNDVEDSYEADISEARAPWVENKIDEAVRKLVHMIPDLPDRVTSGAIDPELVTDYVVKAVLRVVRNPQGLETEAEGDYSYKLRTLMASGDIWFPDADLYDLGFVNAQKSATPRTVRVSSPFLSGGLF